jgi:signal transduction histidine kinase
MEAWNPELEQQFQTKVSNDAATLYSTVFRMLIFLLPVLAVPDWFMTPPLYRLHTLGVRLALVTAIAILYFKINWKSPPRWAATALMSLVAIGVTLMAMVSTGYESAYYFGMGLMVYSISLMLPWSARATCFFCTFWCALYVMAIAAHSGFHFAHPELFMNVVAFLFISCVVSTVGALLADRMRRQLFLRGLEVAQEKAARLELAKSVEMRDEFIALASHELKTPIMVLDLNSSLARRKLGKMPEAEVRSAFDHFLDQNSHYVRRLVKLVDNLLEFYNIRAGAPESLPERMDLDTCVRDVATRYQAQFADGGIELELRLDPGVTGTWDRGQIENILSNLLNNVIKHAPKSKLLVHVYQKKQNAYIKIEDSGPGIAPEFREKVFDRFDRGNASSNVGGLGLGLYVARQLTRGLNGDLILQESGGPGTSFLIRIPLESTLSRPVSRPVSLSTGGRSPPGVGGGHPLH